MQTISARTGTRILVVALATATCAAALAACGSSKSAHGASLANAGIKFAQCMRVHGVSSFPDPGADGGINIPSGINPRAPAFLSAQRACAKLLPGGGPSAGSATEDQKLAMLKMSQCMRRHGFSTFPDPRSTAPAPGTGFGLAFGRPGAFIAIPQSLLQSPGFTQAASTCGLPGAGGHGHVNPAPPGG